MIGRSDAVAASGALAVAVGAARPGGSSAAAHGVLAVHVSAAGDQLFDGSADCHFDRVVDYPRVDVVFAVRSLLTPELSETARSRSVRGRVSGSCGIVVVRCRSMRGPGSTQFVLGREVRLRYGVQYTLWDA